MTVTRFCAIRDGLRSYHWTVKSAGTDEYIIARDQAGAMHLTLHRDGELHVRIDTKDGLRTYPIRDFRPMEVRGSTFLAVRIIIPPASCILTKPAKVGMVSVQLRLADESVEFALYYEASSGGSRTPVGLRLPDAFWIGSVEGGDGSRLSIVARRGVVPGFRVVTEATLFSSEQAGPQVALAAATSEGILFLEGMEGRRITGP